MKKPNEFYRKIRGTNKKPNVAGVAFAAVRHPVRSLRQSFGWDRAAMDVAEGIPLDANKHTLQQVFRTLKTWQQDYRGPKLNWILNRLHMPRQRPIINEPKPKLD